MEKEGRKKEQAIQIRSRFLREREEGERIGQFKLEFGCFGKGREGKRASTPNLVSVLSKKEGREKEPAIKTSTRFLYRRKREWEREIQTKLRFLS